MNKRRSINDPLLTKALANERYIYTDEIPSNVAERALQATQLTKPKEDDGYLQKREHYDFYNDLVNSLDNSHYIPVNKRKEIKDYVSKYIEPVQDPLGDDLDIDLDDLDI